MTGLIRIVDATGERDIELSRETMTVGSGSGDAIRVNGNGSMESLVSLGWDSRRATWVLHCPLALSESVSINGRMAVPGEHFPLGNLDTIEFPDVFLHFQRLVAPPMRGGKPLERIELGKTPLAIGRGEPGASSDGSRIDLDHEETSISRIHATIEPEGQDYLLTDRSRLGMELNGAAFTRERLVFGDRFRIAGYIFEFTGNAIRRIQPDTAGSISANKLRVVAGTRTILDEFSLNVTAGEFIGVLGGSGQGKSTLLNALCGINPPTSGEVRIGGVSLTDRERLREIGIGFVPQDDIVHRELTVTDAVTYSARLRLNLPRHQLDALITRILARLGLAPFARQRVADLSGGQRKRVSIAIELLAKPSVLFLDEPSSGLDPATEEALMTLLQSLTLTKLTVVCTTHVLQKAYLFDRILFVQGGKLVFAGHPDEARQHFLFNNGGGEGGQSLENSPIERVYVILANTPKSAAEWEQQYLASPFANRALPPLPPRQTVSVDRESLAQLKVAPLKTFFLLASRQWAILRSDFLNWAFLLVQPLLIGTMVGWVADKEALRMFLCIVATMWFGCSNGAQQIVGELPIFRRERVSGQGLNAYVLSKVGFLSIVSLLQAMLLFFTTLLVASFFHTEKIDRENLVKDFRARIDPVVTQAADSSEDSGEFDAVDTDKPAAATPTRSATPRPSKPGVIHHAIVEAKVRLLVPIATFFNISQNILDSGPRTLARADGTPLRDAQGKEMQVPGMSVTSVVAFALGLRFVAIGAAALVGVSIGLTISSLVKNTTQAVLWVPLILIPQILFGGIVVTVPDMSRSVRAFSYIMPSFAAQRIMDVASLYGLATPFLTNRTKTPLFLTSRGEKETIEWEADGRTYSQSYDKLSPVNTSWQNLAVIADHLGQHKQVGDRSDNGFRVEYRDTVETRRDVRFSKGTIFRSTQAFYLAAAILGSWIVICYGVILYGLVQKQTGK
jgi:ABC-type multidrug transport system ATPase subunit